MQRPEALLVFVIDGVIGLETRETRTISEEQPYGLKNVGERVIHMYIVWSNQQVTTLLSTIPVRGNASERFSEARRVCIARDNVVALWGRAAHQCRLRTN